MQWDKQCYKQCRNPRFAYLLLHAGKRRDAPAGKSVPQRTELAASVPSDVSRREPAWKVQAWWQMFVTGTKFGRFISIYGVPLICIVNHKRCCIAHAVTWLFAVRWRAPQNSGCVTCPEGDPRVGSESIRSPAVEGQTKSGRIPLRLQVSFRVVGRLL